MSPELVVKAGTIVDGTGAEPFAADLAIDDGRITEIGGKIGGGGEVIDATGMVVSPGFVDIHTHLDAEKVAERQPELVNDFPGGAPRYIQRSTGYKATIVNGKVNVLDGEHTGIRAGEVIRHGR